MSDVGKAPEPSQQEVEAAFGGDVAENFAHIRQIQKASVGDQLVGSFSFTPPDPEMVKIVRLFLEKYEVLDEEDKKLYRRLISLFSNPPLIVKAEQ